MTNNDNEHALLTKRVDKSSKSSPSFPKTFNVENLKGINKFNTSVQTLARKSIR